MCSNPKYAATLWANILWYESHDGNLRGSVLLYRNETNIIDSYNERWRQNDRDRQLKLSVYVKWWTDYGCDLNLLLSAIYFKNSSSSCSKITRFLKTSITIIIINC